VVVNVDDTTASDLGATYESADESAPEKAPAKKTTARKAASSKSEQ
jgi:hypothetical protein